MKKEMVAMILAGGRGTRLEALTAKVAKPAVHSVVDIVLLIFHFLTVQTQTLILSVY